MLQRIGAPCLRRGTTTTTTTTTTTNTTTSTSTSTHVPIHTSTHIYTHIYPHTHTHPHTSTHTSIHTSTHIHPHLLVHLWVHHIDLSTSIYTPTSTSTSATTGKHSQILWFCCNFCAGWLFIPKLQSYIHQYGNSDTQIGEKAKTLQQASTETTTKTITTSQILPWFVPATAP